MKDHITVVTTGLFVEVGKVVQHMEAQAKRIAELEAQLAEVQEDAERYRYLRDAHNFPQMIWDALEGIGSDTEEGYGRGMDTAIDAARNQLDRG